MDNRIIIRSITIKNFRSIRRETIKVNNFNIFVGTNDAGKSNILKALNLFFNDQVDVNSPFDYERDFTYLYPPKSKEAKAITISIQFDIPLTFTDGGVYVWEKVWKRTGKVSDEIKNKEGKALTPRSRIPSALQRIKYRYVPAVKSPDYYKALLGDLYASVAASLDTTLADAVDSFSDSLGAYTQKITLDVSKRLGISSQLTIPTDLNEIFKALIFRTNRKLGEINVPLTARGDGIQARHIPIILKYISQEDQKSRNQGSTKITTIWGFEEPENGLELANAFALAEEFLEYSSDLQIFLTTHSPAFYMKKEESGVKIFYVEKKKKGSEETTISVEINTAQIAENMGLMPLVAPFIAEQAHKLEIAQNIYSKNILTDVPIIMVEGETDVEYLKLAIKHNSSVLQKKLDERELRIVYKQDGAGTTQLCDWALSWIYSGFRSKLYILLDKDEAGIKARDEIVNEEVFKTRKCSSTMRIANIQPSNEIISLYQKKINFYYEIEHLCSVAVWKGWKTRGLVSLREDKELRKMFESLIPRDKSLDNIIDELVEDTDVRDTIVSFEPKKLKKNKMVEYLKENFGGDKNAFVGFEKTIKDIENYFRS